MAIFGLDSQSKENPAVLAINAAEKILLSLKDFNKYLESVNKLAKTSVLVSEATYSIAKDNYKWKKKFTTHVKGKELPIVVYEPDFG